MSLCLIGQSAISLNCRIFPFSTACCNHVFILVVFYLYVCMSLIVRNCSSILTIKDIESLNPITTHPIYDIIMPTTKTKTAIHIHGI